MTAGFKPWIGKYYGKKDSMFDFRILLIAHSHPYRAIKLTREETIGWVKDISKKGSMPAQFGKRIMRMFKSIHTQLGNSHNEMAESDFNHLFWNSISYSVAIPHGIKNINKAGSPGRAKNPTASDWKTVSSNIPKIVKKTDPDIIVCLGKSTFTNILKYCPGDDFSLSRPYKIRISKSDADSREAKSFPNYYYFTTPDNKSYPIYGCFHPSGGMKYLNGEGAPRLIHKFIKAVRND